MGSFATFAAVVAAPLLLSSVAAAATFDVNSTADTHDRALGDGRCEDTTSTTRVRRCSLRAAIEEANQTTSTTRINVPAGTYRLGMGMGPLEVTGDGTKNVYGASAGNTIVDGQNLSRILNVNTGSGIHMRKMTLQNGRAAGDGEPGGAVRIDRGYLDAFEVIFRNNSTANIQGGAIAVGAASVYLVSCFVTNNQTPLTSGGGGVTHSGGGMFLFLGAYAYIEGSTFSGNTSERGGAIAGGGILYMLNSTISGNTAGISGGGLRPTGSDADWRVAFSTIANNVAFQNSDGSETTDFGGGFYVAGATLRLGKSIVTQNTDNRLPSNPKYSPNCAVSPTGRLITYDDNLFGDAGTQCINRTSPDGFQADLEGANDILNPTLQNNGGFTLTHAPAAGFYLWDMGTSGTNGDPFFACPARDQRGVARPRDGDGDGYFGCDSGAYEK